MLSCLSMGFGHMTSSCYELLTIQNIKQRCFELLIAMVMVLVLHHVKIMNYYYFYWLIP